MTEGDPTELIWSVIQTYEDGSEVHWIGPESAQFPAARTRIQAAAALRLSEVLAAAALATAVAGVIIGVLAWRRRASGPGPPDGRGVMPPQRVSTSTARIGR